MEQRSTDCRVGRGRSDAEGKAGHSKGFIAEPFTMNFIDYGDSPANQILGINPLPAGLRLWNANKLAVQTKGKVTTDADEKFDASNNYAGFGNPAEPSPAVTVGLAGVHPLGVNPRRSNSIRRRPNAPRSAWLRRAITYAISIG